MNPNEPLPDEISHISQKYIGEASSLYIHQDIRANNYDIVVPRAELARLMRQLEAEIRVMIQTERSNEISVADNRLDTEFDGDFKKFRDVRLKELSDERTDLRSAGTFRQ